MYTYLLLTFHLKLPFDPKFSNIQQQNPATINLNVLFPLLQTILRATFEQFAYVINRYQFNFTEEKIGPSN